MRCFGLRTWLLKDNPSTLNCYQVLISQKDDEIFQLQLSAEIDFLISLEA